MSHDAAPVDDFMAAVRHAFICAAFVAPRVGVASVLVFDSALWLAHVAAAADVLDAAERQRAGRFHFERDYSTYVLAHAIWRVSLGRCLERELTAVPLTSALSGQPQLPGTCWATSLSHSGRWVAMAAARARTLGVDIEQSPSPRTLNDVLPMICTPTEADDMRQLPLAEREQALLALWTCKEALLKAFGSGLTVAPSTLSVTVGVALASPLAKSVPPCRVGDLPLPPGLVGALAAPIEVERCRLHLLDEARVVDIEIFRPPTDK